MDSKSLLYVTKTIQYKHGLDMFNLRLLSSHGAQVNYNADHYFGLACWIWTLE